jgi:hypothetical protein
MTVKAQLRNADTSVNVAALFAVFAENRGSGLFAISQRREIRIPPGVLG